MIWDLSGSPDLVEGPQAHRDAITAIALTPNATRAVSASKDKTLKVWNVRTGEGAEGSRIFVEHSKPVTAVAVTPDGRYLISGSQDRTLKVWDFRTGIVVRTLDARTSLVKALTVTPDSLNVISAGVSEGGIRGFIQILRLSDGQMISMVDSSVASSLLALDEDQYLLAAAGTNVELWSLKSGLEKIKSWDFDCHVACLAAVQTSRALFGLGDKSLRLWDLSSGTELGVMQGHPDWVSAVAISADGTWGVSACRRIVNLWSLAEKQVIASFTADALVKACAITPDKKTIVAGDDLGRMHFLRPQGCRL